MEGESDGTLLPLALMIESRCELLETDARDILDARRDRAAVINISVSCSLIGDGPGTGGRGDEGGAKGGSLNWGEGTGEGSGEVERGKGDEGLPECRGEGGMKDGGTGKDSSRTGTAGRLSRPRVSEAILLCKDARVSGQLRKTG